MLLAKILILRALGRYRLSLDSHGYIYLYIFPSLKFCSSFEFRIITKSLSRPIAIAISADFVIENVDMSPHLRLINYIKIIQI